MASGSVPSLVSSSTTNLAAPIDYNPSAMGYMQVGSPRHTLTAEPTTTFSNATCNSSSPANLPETTPTNESQFDLDWPFGPTVEVNDGVDVEGMSSGEGEVSLSVNTTDEVLE
jgi:hypothetical protein